MNSTLTGSSILSFETPEERIATPPTSSALDQLSRGNIVSGTNTTPLSACAQNPPQFGSASSLFPKPQDQLQTENMIPNQLFTGHMIPKSQGSSNRNSSWDIRGDIANPRVGTLTIQSSITPAQQYNRLY